MADGFVAARFPCPCCGYDTLREPPLGTWEICAVCRWEDDPAQGRDPDYPGGANPCSLNEARANFKAFGASHEVRRPSARPPRDDERPAPG
ncbi:MAG TPA: CPCC family cysteine-rich protein [Acidimicrobiia bacterium]|jgi:hypothetical protein